MKPNFFVLLVIALIVLLCACQPELPSTANVPAQQSEIITKPPSPSTSTVDYGTALLTARPYPREYCLQQGKPGPLAPPDAFLYLPFKGTISDNSWASQMDHDRPDYTRNGKLAALGGVGQFDRNDAEYSGGTQVYPSKQIFDYLTPINLIESQGFRILSYRLPGAELFSTKETYWSYYDGHDGQDFDASGDALAGGDGLILFKGNYADTLGNVVEIFHPQGYVTRYAHLASFADNIQAGKPIKAGQPVGKIGGSAVINGQMELSWWGPHLHFSVFRWNEQTGSWAITDPFGWDPWAGPDQASRNRAQQHDPLVKCNGEISYDLWVDNWPHNIGEPATSQAYMPNQDRYLGGYYYDEPVIPTVTATPSITPITPTITATITFTPTPSLTPTPSPVAPDYNIAYVYQGNIYLAKVANNQIFSAEAYTQDAEGGNSYPAWSPDGRYILYTHSDASEASLRILDVWTGQTTMQIPLACCGAWNPNNGDIAYVKTDAGVVISAAPDNSRPTVVWSLFPGMSAFGRGAWAANGTLYLALARGENTTQVWAIYEGQAEQVIGSGGFGSGESDVMSSPAVTADGSLSVTIHTEHLAVAPGGPHTYFGYGGVTRGGFGRWIGDLGFGDNASWSPDGQKILLELWVGCNEMGIDFPGFCMGGLGIRNVYPEEETLILKGEEYIEPAWKPE